MRVKKRGHVRYWCAKKWDPRFENDQNFEKRNSYLESRMDINANGDELSIFLRDSEESGSSSLVEEMVAFCNGYYVEEEETRRGAAWLDDRTFGVTRSKGVRIYENRLTPDALCKHLKTPVRSHDYHAKKH